jgi:hypothetical protein
LDDLLGLVFLALYIVAIVGLAAAITWAVIRIFPTERTPAKAEPATAPANGGSQASAGSLFRRSKKKS